MNHLIIGIALVAGLIISAELTTMGLASQSWKLLWSGAVLSLALVVPLMGLAPFILLLISFQLAAAVALRWTANIHGWFILLSAAVIFWLFAVPVPLLLGGSRWLLLLVPVEVILALVATSSGPRDSQIST